MTSYDLFLISPPLALAALAMLVIVVDLLTRRTGLLVGLSFVGLAAPAALSAWQALELTSSGASQLTAEGSVVLHTLSIDRFSLFFNFLILAAVGLVVLVSTDYVRRMERLQGEFFALMLLSATGMMLLVSAHELITMYIALELTTLPLAALAAFLPNGRSSEAGMKFLIIGALSSALMLYGMALIYGFTGSTQLDQIAAALSAGASAGVFPFGSMAVLLAIVLLLVGFGFKMSAAPFQMWVPDVYEGAPTPMVAFLSVASKAAAFALVLRVFYIGFEALEGDWWVLLAGLAALSMTVGNLVAIAQRNIKRMFGYSTVAHAGYILVGVAAVAYAEDILVGPSSVLFYLAAYTAANLTAFFAIVCIGNRINSDEIYDYSGMVRRAPFLAITLALSLIALIGLPPTGLFFAKIYVFAAAINTGESLMTWLVIIGVVNSVVSAYYYLRVIKVMFLQTPIHTERVRASWPVNVALGVATLALLWLGVAPMTLLGAAERAVSVLAGG
ncbi:MAG: NADH-quinone oxidoreductase subunit N [Chloroflexi bacterium]|nr:NADH-quinone oxidoreductase subunit N [Chloroflexota bacterium]